MKTRLFLLACLCLIFPNDASAHSLWDDFVSVWGNPDEQITCYNEFHRNVYVAIILLTSISAVLGVYGFVVKKKANEQLEAQNAEISRQKEEIETQRDDIDAKSKHLQEAYKQITDSINYAQRIQQSLLPSERQLRELLPESMLLFRPRDIVSGDFYWFMRRGTYLVVIVADCTGHGIPGALMSIIANDALNRIIVQEENTAPAKILHLLNEYVTSTLQKNDTVSEDGLDIAVCTLCSSEKTIRYAGAKNSLYYVRNSELHEIKASKHSIGGLDYDITKEFVEHSFAFEPTDKFYMCSDGFADQLGGPFGKKFLSNRLRSLLFETANEPFLEQQQVFASAHNAWRGQNKQTDDITILGFSPLES